MKQKRAGRVQTRHVLSLAEHFRQAAAESDLSIYRIAKETGIDQSTLNKFINGDRDNLRLDVADRLYRHFFQPPRRRRVSSIRCSSSSSGK